GAPAQAAAAQAAAARVASARLALVLAADTDHRQRWERAPWGRIPILPASGIPSDSWTLPAYWQDRDPAGRESSTASTRAGSRQDRNPASQAAIPGSALR